MQRSGGGELIREINVNYRRPLVPDFVERIPLELAVTCCDHPNQRSEDAMGDASFRQKPSTFAATLTIAVVCILLISCAAVVGIVFFAGGSAGGTLSSGRRVVTHSDSLTLKSKFEQDIATIETAGRRIVVEPERLIVDGMIVTEIAAESRDVEIHVERGIVEFIIDGRSLPPVL